MTAVFKKQAEAGIPLRFDAAPLREDPEFFEYREKTGRLFRNPKGREQGGFQLGNFSVSLEAPNLFRVLKDGPYRPFLDPSGNSKGLTLRFVEEEFTEKIEGRLIYRIADGIAFFKAPFFRLLLDLNQWNGWGFVRKMEYTPMDQIIRLCALICAPFFDSFFVHGCALIFQKRGYLFTGSSGSGKTTLANSSDRFSVLSDEMVLVDCSGSTPFLCGTPFIGTSFKSKFAPGMIEASGLFFLNPSPRDALLEMPPFKSCRLLGKTVFHPRFMSDSSGNILDLLSRFTHAVPAFQLEFTRSARFLDLIPEPDGPGRQP